MRKLLLILLSLLSPLQAANVFSTQPGTSLTIGDWNNVSASLNGLAGTKFPYYITGWERYFYNPVTDTICGVESAYELSSEPNRNWYCYSFKEHRSFMMDMAGSFHNEHLPSGGHPMGWTAVNPMTGVGLASCQGNSGSQVQEMNKWDGCRYDFAAQVGLMQQTPQAITESNQLGTATYNPFNQTVKGFGGDSSNQGDVQYDDNPLHTTATSNGYNAFNTWFLQGASTLNGLPTSLILHSMAENLSDTRAYLFAGFANAGTHNWVWYNTPGTGNAPGSWTNVFADVNSSAQATGTVSISPTVAIGSTNDILSVSIDGGSATTVTLTNGARTCGQVAADITTALGAAGFAWCPLLSVVIVSNSNLGASTSVELLSVSNSAYSTLGFTSGTVYAGSTSASCTDLNGLPNCPYLRNAAGFAYDSAENFFLMHGGCRISNISGCAALTDTWIFDPVAVTWKQLNPVHQPVYAVGLAANERLTYIPEDDVFMLWSGSGGSCAGESPSCAQLWAFRYSAGGNIGYMASKTYSYATPSSPLEGPLNRNTTSSTAQSWVYGTAIAANANGVYLAQTETAVTQIGASPANSWLLHPYVQAWNGSALSNLGSSYSSLSPDISSNPQQSFDISGAIAASGSQPCFSWHQENAALTETAYGLCWNGSAWSTGGAIPQVATTAYDGQVASIMVGSALTVLMREQDRTTGNVPYPTYCYLKQWNGTSWVQLGGALNSGFSVCDGASLATDGTNVWAAFTVYGPYNSGAANDNGVWVGPPQVNLAYWNGSTLTSLSTSGNVLGTGCTGMLNAATPPTYVGSGCSRAFNTAITIVGGVPYVAWTERTDQQTIQKLWLRKFSSGAWSTVGGTPLNRDLLNGWPFRPELGTDGTSIFAAWSEQGNSQSWVGTLALTSAISQKPQVYVSKISTAGAITPLGGSLNIDTANGSATHPVLAMYNAQPVVEYGEVETGSQRQAYVKEWNGMDWGPLIGAVTPVFGRGGMSLLDLLTGIVWR